MDREPEVAQTSELCIQYWQHTNCFDQWKNWHKAPISNKLILFSLLSVFSGQSKHSDPLERYLAIILITLRDLSVRFG